MVIKAFSLPQDSTLVLRKGKLMQLQYMPY